MYCSTRHHAKERNAVIESHYNPFDKYISSAHSGNETHFAELIKIKIFNPFTSQKYQLNPRGYICLDDTFDVLAFYATNCPVENTVHYITSAVEYM